MEKTKSERNQYILRKYFGYAVGAIGMDLSYGLFNSILNVYFTDVLLISSFFLSILVPCARIWDGINDPMMGTIVDNTHSRAGKFRPWILTGSILNAIVLVFLFTNPGFSVQKDVINIGLYVYVAVTYVLWGMSYTIVDIPYWSMVPALTNDPEERNLAATFPRAFSGLGQIIIVALTVTMVETLGGGSEPVGYSRWAGICSVILVLGCVVTFFTTKEKVQIKADDSEKFTLRRAFQTIKSNDQLLVFILTAICFNTGWYLTNGLGLYYFKSVIENDKLYGVFGIICGAGQALGLLLLPILSKRFTRNRVIKGAMLLTIMGYLCMGLFGPVLNLFIPFAIFGVLGSMGIGCMFVAETIMLADIVDYGEFKLGYRSDSIVFSMKSFLLKVAYSIQALIMNAGLWVSHYNGDLAKNGLSQPASAQNAICVMMFLIPPIFVLLSLFIFSKKYKLGKERMEEVTAFITEKHAQEQSISNIEK
ncbi:MAG: glycoside-pentoside-hexuronide (GPH):cation symporter [Clostridiales bacterium]|nr:glycoside-pentoside-hexuronide (GPH):cation symporter [Clostridiales bacterium]